MARRSKSLKELLGSQDVISTYESLSKKEQERVYKEIVRETNRALKTATTYTKQQFAMRIRTGNKQKKARNENVAKVYKTKKRAENEIVRSLVVLRTEASLKEISKTKTLTAKEASWESMQEDNYFREWIQDFAQDAGMKISESEVEKMFRAYEALKSETHVRTYDEYQKLAQEVFTAWQSGQGENWDSIRTQVFNQWQSGSVSFSSVDDDIDDVF